MAISGPKIAKLGQNRLPNDPSSKPNWAPTGPQLGWQLGPSWAGNWAPVGLPNWGPSKTGTGQLLGPMRASDYFILALKSLDDTFRKCVSIVKVNFKPQERCLQLNTTCFCVNFHNQIETLIYYQTAMKYVHSYTFFNQVTHLGFIALMKSLSCIGGILST